MLSPWTRDGRVVADSVTVAAEVSGRIVKIRVRENEYVKKGDIVFTVDQATYKAALDKAQAILSSGMTVTVSIIQGSSSKKERIAEIQDGAGGPQR